MEGRSVVADHDRDLEVEGRGGGALWWLIMTGMLKLKVGGQCCGSAWQRIFTWKVGGNMMAQFDRDVDAEGTGGAKPLLTVTEIFSWKIGNNIVEGRGVISWLNMTEIFTWEVGE